MAITEKIINKRKHNNLLDEDELPVAYEIWDCIDEE